MKKILLFICVIYFAINLPSVLTAQNKNTLDDIVMIEGTYLRDLGTFGTYWSGAAGFYLGYGKFFADHNLLMVRTGFMSHSARENTNYYDEYNPEQSYPDAYLSVIPVHIGGRYYFTNESIMPYFQFMNGINIIFENVNSYNNNDYLLNGKESRTLVRYLWQIGAGATYSISNNINVDLGVHYNAAFYENSKDVFGSKGAMMTGFEYSIGFGWKLNN